MYRRVTAALVVGILLTFATAWAQYFVYPRVGRSVVSTLDPDGNVISSEETTWEDGYKFVGRADVRFSSTAAIRSDDVDWGPLERIRGEAYGVPWRGLMVVHELPREGGLIYSISPPWGLPLRGSRLDQNTGDTIPRALPIVPTPLWLADVTFWSGAGWLALCATARRRRSVRRRRGLYQWCGHSRERDSVSAACPECGR